jgi:hypothetical protein
MDIAVIARYKETDNRHSHQGIFVYVAFINPSNKGSIHSMGVLLAQFLSQQTMTTPVPTILLGYEGYVW